MFYQYLYKYNQIIDNNNLSVDKNNNYDDTIYDLTDYK